MNKRAVAYWEDIDPDIRRNMATQAFRTDSANQEYFSGLKRTALAKGTRKFSVSDGGPSDTYLVKDVTRMGGVKERSIYNTRTKKSTLISRVDPKRTWTIFDGMNDPADIAGVFGVKYESAFDKLPPRKPTEVQKPAAQGAPAPNPAPGENVPKVTPVDPKGPTPEEKSNPEQPVKSLGLDPELRNIMGQTPRFFRGTRIDPKDLANRRSVLSQYSVPDGMSKSDFAEIRSRVLSHGSYSGYDAKSEVDARVLAKQLGVVYTGGDVNDVRKAAEERRKRGLA